MKLEEINYIIKLIVYNLGRERERLEYNSWGTPARKTPTPKQNYFTTVDPLRT